MRTLYLLCLQGKQLAEAALLNADTSRLRVAAHVLLGRCCHALGDFSGAQQHYGQVGAGCPGRLSLQLTAVWLQVALLSVM
jgi:hypothetical protein